MMQKEITGKIILALIIILFVCQTILLIYILSASNGQPTGLSVGTGITKITVKNDPPDLITIPDQTWSQDESITINLSDYFSDPERIPLTFSYDPINNIGVSINQVSGIVNLTPSPGWSGVRQITFYASDGPNTKISNLVTLNVEKLPLIVPPPTTPSGGIGGGTGACRYRWECQPWSQCLPGNLQERGCVNMGTCPNTFRPPAVTRPCVYVNNFTKREVEFEQTESEKFLKPEEEIPGEVVIKEEVSFPELVKARQEGERLSNIFFFVAGILAIAASLIFTSGFWYPLIRPWFFFLADVPEDKAFIANDDQVARNLKEMAEILLKMKKETFDYHVNKDENHVADWISKIVKDRELASKLRKAKKTKTEYANIINKIIGVSTKKSK